MNTLQKNLQELQESIEGLKRKKQSANGRMRDMEKQISELYAKPLNERQMMQLMQTVVDERAKFYKDDVLNGGHLEAQKNQGKRTLSLDDFCTITGVGRMRGGSQVYRDDQLAFKLELFKNYGTGINAWMPFFFGDLIKQKIEELYRSKYGGKDFTALESIEERIKSIKQLNEEVLKLESEISAIDTEIEEISGPVKNFMRSV